MLRGLHHVAMGAEDVDRLAAFYVDNLGFEVVWDCDVVGSERIVFLRTGNAFVELFEAVAPPSRLALQRPVSDSGYLHMCVAVDDLDAAYQRLVRAGVAFESPPIDATLLRFCFLADCEGNRVELMEIVDDRTPFHLQRAGAQVADPLPALDAVTAGRAAEELRAVANGRRIEPE